VSIAWEEEFSFSGLSNPFPSPSPVCPGAVCHLCSLVTTPSWPSPSPRPRFLESFLSRVVSVPCSPWTSEAHATQLLNSTVVCCLEQGRATADRYHGQPHRRPTSVLLPWAFSCEPRKLCMALKLLPWVKVDLGFLQQIPNFRGLKYALRRSIWFLEIKILFQKIWIFLGNLVLTSWALGPSLKLFGRNLLSKQIVAWKEKGFYPRVIRKWSCLRKFELLDEV
jgi:hypothetical protein